VCLLSSFFLISKLHVILRRRRYCHVGDWKCWKWNKCIKSKKKKVMTNPCWKDDLQFLGKQPHPLVGLSYLKFHTGLFCEKVSKIIWTKKVFYDKSLTRFAFPKLFSKSFAYYKSMLLLSLENIDFFTLLFLSEIQYLNYASFLEWTRQL